MSCFDIAAKSTNLRKCNSPITGPRCPEGSRKLRFPDCVTMAQDGGKVFSLTHRPFFYPQEMYESVWKHIINVTDPYMFRAPMWLMSNRWPHEWQKYVRGVLSLSYNLKHLCSFVLSLIYLIAQCTVMDNWEREFCLFRFWTLYRLMRWCSVIY